LISFFSVETYLYFAPISIPWSCHLNLPALAKTPLLAHLRQPLGIRLSPSPVVDEDDFCKMSSSGIISAVMARITDPIANKMLQTLRCRIHVECMDMIEKEKRGQSIVLAGLGEAPDLSPSLRLKDLENKVENIMSVLQVECRPSEIHRMGRFDRLALDW
ncbi:hypothetical protein ANCDUO_13247, partial [Ancylostoma duodenale]